MVEVFVKAPLQLCEAALKCSTDLILKTNEGKFMVNKSWMLQFYVIRGEELYRHPERGSFIGINTWEHICPTKSDVKSEQLLPIRYK